MRIHKMARTCDTLVSMNLLEFALKRMNERQAKVRKTFTIDPAILSAVEEMLASKEIAKLVRLNRKDQSQSFSLFLESLCAGALAQWKEKQKP